MGNGFYYKYLITIVNINNSGSSLDHPVCKGSAYCGLKKVEGMDKKQLFIELKGIQGRGIMIFLEGEQSTPETVTDLLCVQEEKSSYMRDYVYDKGVLTELHFDKVQNE